MKFKFKSILLISFLAVAGLLSVSGALANKHSQNINTAEASTTSPGGICLIVEDQISEWAKWTYYNSDGDQRNAYAKLTNLKFDSTSVVSTASDLTNEMFRSVPGDTIGYDFNVDGSTVYVSMYYQGTCNFGHGRKYCLALPWVITSCTVSYYGHKSNDLTQYTLAQNGGSNPYTVNATRGNSYGCYIYDRSGTGWDGNTFYGIISSTTSTFSYDITTYQLTYNTNGGTVDVDNPQTYKQFQKTVQPGATKSGYGIIKWTTDQQGQTEFTFGNALTANQQIYAQWAVVKRIYYVTNSASTTVDYIYSWGNGYLQFGAFPGGAIKDVGTDVTGVIRFQNGEYKKIYLIEIYNTDFKFNNGKSTAEGGSESSNFTVTDGSAYWWTGPDLNAGRALDYLIKIENARNAVPASGSIRQYSICGINPSTASSLVNEYNGLSSEAKVFVNGAKTYTYDGYGPDETLVDFPDIINRLSIIAGGNGLNAIRNFSPFILTGEDGNVLPTVIIITASSIALLSITALSVLVIKKRKRKEE